MSNNFIQKIIRIKLLKDEVENNIYELNVKIKLI